MENKKAVLITIIVLLCVSIPSTIIGFIYKGDRNLLEDNPNHDFYYQGSLWFYSKEDQFLSEYECQTEVCELAAPTIDDSTYGIKYYNEGTVKQVAIEDEKFTFITDGAVINLYDVTTGKTLQTYKGIKNYNTNLANQTYILQDEKGLWGALSVSSMLNEVLPFEYDFVGLIDKTNDEGILSTEKFIVLKDNKWYLVDSNNSSLTGYIDDPIIDYTTDYVFSKAEDRIKIYSYQNYEYLTDYKINDYIVEDKYIGIVTDNFLLIYENLGVSYIKSVTLTNTNGEIKLEKDGNKLNVKVNDTLIESVEVS